MPNDTTGPNSGSSSPPTATGTPGGASLDDEARPRRGSSISCLHATPRRRRISASVSMLRHTCARSGRWRSCSAVALRTTSQPSRSAGGDRLVGGGDRRCGPTARCRRPPAARAAPRRSRSRPPRAVDQDLVDTSCRARHRVHVVRRRPSSPCGLARHAAYSDDPRQRAHGRLDRGVRRHRPAAGGAAGHVGHAQQLRHALRGRGSVETSGLSDCSPTAASTLATSSPVAFERRDVDRDDGVDVGVVDRRVERVLEVLGGRVGAERDRAGRRRSPTATAASAASSPSASELPTMATRRPRGSGWWASSWATSNISSRVSTWITPACRNIASTAACGAQRSGGRRGPSARPASCGRTAPR